MRIRPPRPPPVTLLVGTAGNDFGYGVAADPSGDVFLAGLTTGSLDNNAFSGSQDLFLAKFGAGGGKEWIRQRGPAEARAVARDGGGNLYVAGSTGASLDGRPYAGGTDVVVVKYDASGNWVWTAQFGPAGSDTWNDITVAPNGNVYVAGDTYGALGGATYAGNGDVFLAKVEQNKVRRLNFNQWTETSDVWIPPAEWDGCAATAWPDLRGTPCYGGLDLSMTRDLSAFSLVWPVDDVFYTRTWFWLPEADLQDRIKRDGVRYDLWTPQCLELTPGEVVDYRCLTNRIADLSRVYKIQNIPYDRWGAEPTRQALESDGVKVMQFGQSYTSMSAASQQLENLVFGRKIQHDSNPIMRWNFSGCTKMEDPAQNVKPVKDKGSSSAQRIDGVVSLVMAIGAAMGAERPVPVVLIGAV